MTNKKKDPLYKSFGYALQGIAAGIKKERNMKIHCGAAVLVTAAGVMLGISGTEWCICLVLFGLVMALELVNTAIEAAVDLATEEKRPLAKLAKDAAAGAVLVAAIMAAAVGMIIFLPKMLPWIQKADARVLLYIQENIRHEKMHIFWKSVTFLGDAGWFWIVLAVLLLFPKKTRKAGITALLALGMGALLTNVLLKNLVARPRPYDAWAALIPLVKRLSDYSFPSGHTCASFASAFVYYRMLPRKYGLAAIVLAALIALSRLYLGMHYPTDVLAGFLVGSLSGLFAYHVTRRFLQ